MNANCDAQVNAALSLVASGTLTFGQSKVNLRTGLRSTAAGHIQVAAGQEIRVVEERTRIVRPGARRQLEGTGNKYFTVFHVTDSTESVHPDSATVMSDNVFGTGGDNVNLVSQLRTCSNGRSNAIPGGLPGYDLMGIQSAPNVVNITIGVPHEGSYEPMRVAAQRKLNEHFGNAGALDDYMDHALFMVPEGTYQWSAYAHVGSFIQVYQGAYYSLPGVLLHKHGHNMEVRNAVF